MGVKVREKVKGSGECWVFVNHEGKRASKKVGDKRTANAVKKQLEMDIARGEWDTVKSEMPTLNVQSEIFINSPLRDWSERTYDRTRDAYSNYIEPVLGKLPIDEIRPRHIKKLLSDILAKGLSSSTARTALRTINGIMQDAVEDELIPTNPCLRMGKYCGNGTVKDVNPLEAHEVAQLLKNAKSAPIVYHTLIVVAVRTGLRIGELMALEWSDVDFEGRTLSVNKSYDYNHGKVKIPKSEKSIRTVRLTAQTVEALKELYEVTGPAGIVFTEDGNHLKHHLPEKWIKVVAPRHRRITLHTLRHTYASLRLAKGDNVVDVSNQLGHSSVEITLKVYTHWLPSADYVYQVDELDTLHLSAPQAHPGSEERRDLH